ncbi:MAG: hypothetical protein NT007_07990 [Candidatus Kapabacteria bacterium]|nr:hypothetical protein [Candidatus Kapabacteria bacterium]
METKNDFSSLREYYRYQKDIHYAEPKAKIKRAKLLFIITLSAFLLVLALTVFLFLSFPKVFSPNYLPLVLIVSLFLIFKIRKSYFSILNLKKKLEELFLLNKFVCPHCLRTIFSTELSGYCPLCSKPHILNGENKEVKFHKNEVVNRIVNEVANNKEFELFELEDSLFNKCKHCEREIPFIQCPHCKELINLLAPYNLENIYQRTYNEE